MKAHDKSMQITVFGGLLEGLLSYHKTIFKNLKILLLKHLEHKFPQRSYQTIFPKKGRGGGFKPKQSLCVCPYKGWVYSLKEKERK